MISWKNAADNHDTSPEVQAILAQRYAELSGEERMMMAMSMFDSARAMVLASKEADKRDGESDKHWLWRRLYGEELADQAFPDDSTSELRLTGAQRAV